MSKDFDLIVIGAGSGGVRAARIAAGLGARVAIVEGRFFGGTCVNVGCVPKKLFSYAAAMPGQISLAGDFGFSVSGVQHDWTVLRANKDREIARLNGIYQQLLADSGVTVYEGYGRITAEGEVTVGNTVLSGRNILVATGGKPFVPDIQGKEHILVSDDLFSLPALPGRVAVVGGGYIATEFACILAGLGCDTSQYYRGELFLRGFDEDVRRVAAREIAHRGVNLRFGTDISAVEKSAEGYTLSLSDGSSTIVDAVFYATGRVPMTEGLFDGVAPEQAVNGAIRVDDNYQTSVPGLYAIGDVIDRIQLTPVALAEGMWLARYLFAPESAGPSPEYDLVPTAVFSLPNIGTVGLSESEAVERHGRVRIYESGFRALKYTLGDTQHRSYMKLVVDDASDEVIGLHMVGDDAGEIVQGFAVAMRMGAKKSDFDRTVGIHPTSAEEFVTMRTAARTLP